MLVDQAKASGAKRWAIVAPNYEYGQSAAEVFKRLIKERIPGAEIVAEQYPALGKIEAGATVSALEQAKPDGIFNVLFGADLTQFVREGNTRGLFEKQVPSSRLLTGEPEWLLPLKDEVPEGWTVTGLSLGPDHRAEAQGLRRRLSGEVQRHPRLGSLLGYMVVYMISDTIERAGSTETDAIIKALEDAKFDTVVGPVTMRGIDNQSTMGAWVGKLVLKGASRRHDRLEIHGRLGLHALRSRGEGGAEGVMP